MKGVVTSFSKRPSQPFPPPLAGTQVYFSGIIVPSAKAVLESCSGGPIIIPPPPPGRPPPGPPPCGGPCCAKAAYVLAINNAIKIESGRTILIRLSSLSAARRTPESVPHSFPHEAPDSNSAETRRANDASAQ